MTREDARARLARAEAARARAETEKRVRAAADDCGDALLPLTGAERREVLVELDRRGLIILPSTTAYRALRRRGLRDETRAALPAPETMTAEDLRAEIEGGRDAYEVVVAEVRELRHRIGQLERNVEFWRDETRPRRGA